MKKLAALGALILASGCASVEHEADRVVAAQAPAERVAETLVRGHKALASDGSAQVLADASTRLQDLGAKPADDGEADRAQDWLVEARKRGLETDAVPFRGRVLGPAYRSGSLAPGEASETSQLFLAGEQAEVVAIPVESTALQLEIVEDEGQRNCTPPPTAARSVCRWIPIFTSRYRIRVRNIGERPSAFYLVTN
ncbi:hypothetical protein GCM10023208_28920 [Erythrobacter westpacificensis]|uniref:Lipoprotein n=1 Tax=Erythrobacter westpacificensis TaxID=1055231 RepID=A0ABP9KNS6_9SPHN